MVFMSKALVVWSMEDVTKKSPRSWNAQAHTAEEWSVIVCLHFSLETSQILTLASPDVVATTEPRGWKAMPLTQSVWPSPLRTSWPSGIDHIFHVWSSLAVATTGIFGWKAIREIGPKWPLKVCTFFISDTEMGSKFALAYGLLRSSGGHAAFFSLLVVSPWGPREALSSSWSAASWLTCFCSVSALLTKRSRSSLINIFSFIATSYLCLNSVSVGSYCS
mmetsp:Transcript_77566/g.216789  ORF Transcript_77566/g.216789 Transcript_77566/m.216789 type:complete len:220 (+) Transcript_77566:692-1351(+)